LILADAVCCWGCSNMLDGVGLWESPCGLRKASSSYGLPM
jgi:hypothetical protein